MYQQKVQIPKLSVNWQTLKMTLSSTVFFRHNLKDSSRENIFSVPIKLHFGPLSLGSVFQHWLNNLSQKLISNKMKLTMNLFEISFWLKLFNQCWRTLPNDKGPKWSFIGTEKMFSLDESFKLCLKNTVDDVETLSLKKLAKLAITGSASTNHCGCNHVPEHDTPLPNVIVRRKAASYLMDAKGLRNKVIDKVNRLDHFFQLT